MIECLFNCCAALAQSASTGAVGGTSAGGLRQYSAGPVAEASWHSPTMLPACLLLQAATTDEGETHFNQMGIDV